MGRQVFTAGEILTAANMNDLSDQSVMVFDDATARTTAIPTPVAGMVTYLVDTDSVEKFDGTNFVPVIEAEPPTISQVVSVNMNDTFSTGSPNMIDIPDLTATITPSSASNKVLIIVSVMMSNSGASGAGQLQLADGSNNALATNSAPGSRTEGFSSATPSLDQATSQIWSFNFLHSPATTSPFTYKARVRRVNDTVVINRSGGPEDNNQRIAGSSTITLMEVAG